VDEQRRMRTEDHVPSGRAGFGGGANHGSYTSLMMRQCLTCLSNHHSAPHAKSEVIYLRALTTQTGLWLIHAPG
ncbi:MAG: hypothetical protein ABIF71_14635, partial [Planctomycetota bacterium]